MELYALGSGNAFTQKNWQSNFLIRQNGKYLVIDFGSFAPLALDEMGLKLNDIDAAYVSHIHADHVGGLEALAYTTYFTPNVDRPKLYCQGEYIVDSESNNRYTTGLIKELWNTSLSGGLSGLEGKIAHLDTFFEPHGVDENGSFTWEGITFDIVQTIHVVANRKIEKSYGLMWTDPDTNERVYITTDTQFCPVNAMHAYLKEADVIFNDCETTPYKSGVHAHYSDLRLLSDEVKSKMWLYHFDDSIIENWEVKNAEAIADGFRGFVPTGASFARTYDFHECGTIGKSSYVNKTNTELV